VEEGSRWTAIYVLGVYFSVEKMNPSGGRACDKQRPARQGPQTLTRRPVFLVASSSREVSGADALESCSITAARITVTPLGSALAPVLLSSYCCRRRSLFADACNNSRCSREFGDPWVPFKHRNVLVVSFPFLPRLTFPRCLWLNDNYAQHLFSSRLSAEMGRWPLASELEVNDLFRAGEGRFVGDGDPFPVD